MPEIPMVLPDWGESIGGGLERGFEGVMSGLARRWSMEQKARQFELEQRRANLNFMAQTGYDPERLERGKAIYENVAPIGADPDMMSAVLPPGRRDLFDEWRSFNDNMRMQRTAKTDLAQAQAGLARQRIQNMQGAGGPPQTHQDPVTGKIFYRSMGPSGPTPWVEGQGQNLGVDQARQVSNATSALNNIAEIREILQGPQGKAAILKAGGWGKTLLSFNDPVAQRLGTRLGEASDVLARMRTGAQINEQELRHYSGLLSNRYRTLEGNLDALNVVERFVRLVDEETRMGIRQPGRAYEARIIPLSQGNEYLPQPSMAPRQDDNGVPQRDQTGSGRLPSGKTYEDRFNELESLGLDEDAIYRIIDGEDH